VSGPTDSITDDAFLGGRLRLLQPRRGHRVGHDAALLAAACPAAPGETVVDLGAGVGAVGLAIAARVAVNVLLVESEPALVALARENVRRNGLDGRVAVVEADVTAPPQTRRTAGLGPETADHVVSNPPFYAPGVSRVPDAKRKAHVADPGTFEAWMRSAVSILRHGGRLTLIHRPEALPRLFDAVDGRLGDLRLLGIHAAPGRAALRILLQGTRGRRGGLRLLPGLVLTDPAGRNTAATEAVLRGEALDLDSPIPPSQSRGEPCRNRSSTA
jgi:tRNA1(Val) A37 N6-methylase TrmN6